MIQALFFFFFSCLERVLNPIGKWSYSDSRRAGIVWVMLHKIFLVHTMNVQHQVYGSEKKEIHKYAVWDSAWSPMNSRNVKSWLSWYTLLQAEAQLYGLLLSRYNILFVFCLSVCPLFFLFVYLSFWVMVLLSSSNTRWRLYRMVCRDLLSYDFFCLYLLLSYIIY